MDQLQELVVITKLEHVSSDSTGRSVNHFTHLGSRGRNNNNITDSWTGFVRKSMFEWLEEEERGGVLLKELSSIRLLCEEVQSISVQKVNQNIWLI